MTGKSFFFKILAATGCICALLALAGCGAPKFQNVTLELGDTGLQAKDFLVTGANEEKASFVTESIDYTHVGQQSITLRYGSTEETVVLTIQDTTAPELVLQDARVPADCIAAVEDFVVSCEDASQTQLTFVKAPEFSGEYTPMTVEIVATDAHGNKTQKSCALQYSWLKGAITLELGSTLTAADVLVFPEEDAELLSQDDLDAIDNTMAGEQTLSVDGNSCIITFQDTTPPALVLKEVTIDFGETVHITDFVESMKDASGAVSLAYLQEPDVSKKGQHEVVISATDANSNSIVGETTLFVAGDSTPPTLSGLTDLVVEKGASIQYLDGVSAEDDEDGKVAVSYDSDSVNTSNPGTYYVTYTAEDASGNKVTQKRKIVITPSQADVDALVADIAEDLEADAEVVRDYVRGKIRYNNDWGGESPVWYGFTQWRGNCLVHAVCFQELLEAKGFETQLIWTTDKTHYWVMVKLDGQWKHMDATPSVPHAHSKYSIMSDSQRFETLQTGGHSRDWDRTQWPVCD